jgi:Tfp pilus assembly protein PilF
MNRLIPLVLLLLVKPFLHAQPGGGGGMNIFAIYNSANERLSFRENDFAVRAFVINDYFGNNRSPVSHEIELAKSDTISLSPESSLDLFYCVQPTISLRLYFIYKSDTSIIDFYNVRKSNEAGIVAGIDSLMLKPGYTSYSRVLNKDSVIVKYHPETDVSFLEEKNLAQSFYCAKGVNALRRDDYKAAIEYLLIAENKKNAYGRQELRLLPEVNYRLAMAYLATGEYDKAESHAKDAVRQQRNAYDYYKVLIQAQIKLKKWKDASDTYADALKFLYYSPYNYDKIIRRDWSLFNIVYTRDYDTVINYYKALNAPHEKIYYYPGHAEANSHGDYSENYFMLGLARYAKGEPAAAYNDWLKALEAGYGSAYYYECRAHFDSILSAHPGEPMPNLLNAIALYKAAPYAGSRENSVPLLEQALKNMMQAETAGLHIVSLYTWRARVLSYLERNEKALAQINVAISKDETNPELYFLRASILQASGAADTEKIKNDFDKAQELSCTNSYREMNIRSYVPIAGTEKDTLINMENCISAETFYAHWLSVLPNVKSKENDTTTIYYCDSLSHVFARGVYRSYRHVIKRGKYHFTEPEFRTPKRRVVNMQYRYGKWTYFDIDGNLLLESYYRQKKRFVFKNNVTIPAGTWKYYEKGRLIMQQKYLPDNKVEQIRE